MRLNDALRYALLAGIVATADANRREYHMATTWLPHLLTNTFTLLLPDLYRAVDPPEHKTALQPAASASLSPIVQGWQTLRKPLAAMIRDNPGYVAYVAPLAIGYILSHPRFNIYKGDLSEIRLAGFGLDALPHSATGLALTALACDTADAAARTIPADSPLASIIHEADDHPALFSAAVLVLATSWWELGEYLIHRHELALRGNDVSQINMQWSVEDTERDVASNVIGWLLAILWREIVHARKTIS